MADITDADIQAAKIAMNHNDPSSVSDAAARQYVIQHQQAPSGANPSDPLVYVGNLGQVANYKYTAVPHQALPVADGTVKGYGQSQVTQVSYSDVGTMTVSQAAAVWWNWSAKKQANMIKQFQQAGLHVKTGDIGGGFNTWAQLVQDAAYTKANAASNAIIDGHAAVALTPFQILDRFKSAYKQKGPTTSTSSNTTTYSASDVAAAQQGAWQSALGRDPTAAEQGQAVGGVSSSSSSTSVSKPGGGSTTTTSGSTGVNLPYEDLLKARQAPDYAEYQAATTYFNAMLTAIGRVA